MTAPTSGGRLAAFHASLAVLALTTALASCSMAGGAGDGWSRRYAHPVDRVFSAVLDALEANDYRLDEVDEARGRVRAVPASRSGDPVTLVVEVAQRGGLVQVVLMAQSPWLAEGPGSRSVEAAVRRLLVDLDARLEGRVD